MKNETTFKKNIVKFSSTLFFLYTGTAAAIPPPPKSIELTPSEVQRLKFDYKTWSDGIISHIEIEYPKTIYGTHHPHSIRVSNFDSSGKTISQSEFPASSLSTSFSSNFIKTKVDTSIVMTYCKPEVESCIDFIIRSVNKVSTFDSRKK